MHLSKFYLPATLQQLHSAIFSPSFKFCLLTEWQTENLVYPLMILFTVIMATDQVLFLETKLNGSMKDNATEKERFVIIQWVRDEAKKSEFESSGVKKIIDTKCVMCHNESASNYP